MHIFYTPQIDSNYFTLSEDESKHCIRVLRLKLNDKIQLIDGKGGLYTAIIIDDNIRKCKTEIIESIKDYKKRKFNLHIAISPTKNIDRFEWFVEKATEIGIDEITPMITEHSERRNINIERLNKVIISASKQSINAYFPKLNDVTKIKDILNMNYNGSKYIAYYSDNNLKDIYQPNSNALILIGPEGDFTNEELDNAKANNFKVAGLGNNRLRTETAGIVACTIINQI